MNREFMIEIGSFDNLLVGAAVFIFSFVMLLIVWSAVVRALYSVFGKSKLYFIPKTLKELFLSVSFIVFLVSIAVGIFYTDTNLLTGEFLKIWEILLIFAIVNILVRVILTGIDVQRKAIKDKSGVYRSIGLLKGTAGMILYLVALIISINILSAELGTVVTVIGLFIVVLIFAAGFDQIKSIMAGLQLGDYYVDIGSLITIDGHMGFVDEIHGRSTLLKTIDGRTVVLPNSRFFNTTFEIDPEEVSDMEILARIKAKDPSKIKERISSISSKISIEMEDMLKEYKPRVLHNGVNDGQHAFLITFKITPASNVRRIMDRFCSEFTGAFGDKLVCLKLGGE
jgi:small-conductance mechanosensitive channel